MASLYKKPVLVTDAKTGKKMKGKSKKWWGQYKDANRRLRRVPLAIDKVAAQAMLNKLVREVEREKAGLIDATDVQRKRPLSEHLEEFQSYLRNKGRSPAHVRESTTRIQKLLENRGWRFIGDLSASGVLEYLGKLRADGLSAKTYNHYLQSIKQFSRWLARDGRAPTHPLAYLSRINTDSDPRHPRRPLSPDEFARLINAAQHGKRIENIPGPDRAMMYVLAAWTGFRKGEIGSLTCRSLQLDAEPATATVEACYSKRRRTDTQVLHPEVARRLRDWLATKPDLAPDALLFPVCGRIPSGTERKTNKMMDCDLQVARKKWIEEAKTEKEKEARQGTDFLTFCNDAGFYADFHSNRHLFVTTLARSGVSPKVAQLLARHSDIRLTLQLYTHVELQDQQAAIAALPAPPGIDRPSV
ncbi:MAG: tyrosine recombinase XerC [Gemmataceae bacterium]